MITLDILNQFLNMSYYTQGTIIIKERTATYDKGHVSDGIVSRETLKGKKVWIPVSSSEMRDLGFGQYNDFENYWLYVKTAVKFNSGSELDKSSIVEYKSKNFQIVKQFDFETHGFFGYLCTSFNGVLND